MTETEPRIFFAGNHRRQVHRNDPLVVKLQPLGHKFAGPVAVGLVAPAVDGLRPILPASAVDTHELVHRPAHHGIAGQAQNVLAGHIEQDDVAVGIRHEDAIGNAFQDGAALVASTC